MKFKLTAMLAAVAISYAILSHLHEAGAQESAASSVSTPNEQDRDSGTTDSSSSYTVSNGDNTYTSGYFGLTLKLPPSWTLASEAEAEKIMGIGSDMVAGDDKNMKAMMDASVRQSLPLFFASRHPMSTQKPDNINISSVAENVAAFPQVTRGTQYFDNMKKIAANSATPMIFKDGYSTKMIGGISFDSMKAEIPLEGITVKQDYYAARIDDHVVSIIATYLNDDDKLMLDGLVSNIEID